MNHQAAEQNQENGASRIFRSWLDYFRIEYESLAGAGNAAGERAKEIVLKHFAKEEDQIVRQMGISEEGREEFRNRMNSELRRM